MKRNQFFIEYGIMIQIRKSDERGYADHGWLKSFHTFSFADYRDPDHRNFRKLRVMNEDRVEAGQGFGTHAHNDMEIVSYVLSGQLEHKDSMGNGETLHPGEFQRITAGSGITHSEFNPSTTEPAHFYQIWIIPEKKGIEPAYEQKTFDASQRHNQFQLVASPTAESNSLKIHQDARIYLADLDPDSALDYKISAGRHVWLQVLRGKLMVNNHPVEAGDGVATSEESQLELKSNGRSEVMLLDLA